MVWSILKSMFSIGINTTKEKTFIHWERKFSIFALDEKVSDNQFGGFSCHWNEQESAAELYPAIFRSRCQRNEAYRRTCQHYPCTGADRIECGTVRACPEGQ